VTETAIQAAILTGGTLAWSDDKNNCLIYPVGKQRARLFLGADMLSSFVDRRLSVIRGELSTALQGWERTRTQAAADDSLTEKQERLRNAEAGREIDRLEREMEQLDAFDADRYLYEVAKAALMEDVEFGQMTSLLKKHILDRRGRGRLETLSDEGVILVGVQTSPRSADLLIAVHEARDASPISQETFLEGRILPLTWLLEWLLGNDQLGLELGRSELKAAKILAPWEKVMDGRLRAMHREVVRQACCIRGAIDALELVQGSKNGPVRLKLRSDFIASFLPAFADYRSLSERFDRAREMSLAGLVVVGMGGSGKTTFLRRCYDMLREDAENRGLSEEIDPKSTAFVVGHIFRDVTVPLFDGRKKITLCWMDTAGSEDYRLLGQQLTVSVRELGRRLFLDGPADYNLIFMWSYETGYDAPRDLQGFEDVLSRFMDEVENLGYFDLDLPKKIYLMLNKADIAERDGVAERFSSEHEKRFRSVMERKGMCGESLGLISTLNGDAKDISDRFLVTIFGLSDEDWKRAFVSVRAGINQGIVGNLLETEDAARFKQEVYDRFHESGQETYLRETVAWIERYLAASKGGSTTRALLRSLSAFLSGEMEGDAIS
jgi:hypothetical protein